MNLPEEKENSMYIDFHELKIGSVLWTNGGHRARFEQCIYSDPCECLGIFSIFNVDGDHIKTIKYWQNGEPVPITNSNEYSLKPES